MFEYVCVPVFGSMRAYTRVSLNVCVFVSGMRGKHADERITEDFCLERKVSAWEKWEHGK